MISTLVIGITLTILLVVAITLNSLVVVEAGEEKMLFITGSHRSNLTTGINFVPPIISDIKQIDTTVQEVSVPDVTEVSGDDMRVNAKMSVYCNISDAEELVSSVDNYKEKVWKVAKSEISTIIAESEAESLRRNQRTVELEIGEEIGRMVSDWGVEVNRVEITSISVAERDT